MPYCIIGSHAMQFAGLRVDPPVDLDLIADYDTAVLYLKERDFRNIYPINQGKTLVGKEGRDIIEISLAWPGSTNEELLKYFDYHGRVFATLDDLYALKMSHRYLKDSPHFYKTMKHIHLLRSAGARIPDALQDWFKRREKETYDYSLPKLNQSKENFFSGDGVEYVYDHDSLHEAVAFGAHPIYKMYQEPGSEVAVNRLLWEHSVPHQLKIRAVAEECAVLALERSLVPFPGAKTPLEAFKLALMKVCTSITSGWFREFAWENHDEVLSLVLNNEYDYVAKFEEGLKKGIVKPYDK